MWNNEGIMKEWPSADCRPPPRTNTSLKGCTYCICTHFYISWRFMNYSLGNLWKCQKTKWQILVWSFLWFLWDLPRTTQQTNGLRWEQKPAVWLQVRWCMKSCVDSDAAGAWNSFHSFGLIIGTLGHQDKCMENQNCPNSIRALLHTGSDH